MINRPSKEFGLLSEVSELLDNYKLKHIDVLGNEDSESRYTEFWRLVKSGEIQNDKQAAQHFYQTDENNPNYKKFRLEYRDRLLNMIWHIDAFHPKYKEFESAYLACQERMALIHVLHNNDCGMSVRHLLREVLEQSLKYEFVDISYVAATRLRRIAVNKTEDPEDFEKYSEMCERLEQDYHNMTKADRCYDEVLAFYIPKRALQRGAFNLGEKYLRELKPFFSKNSPVKFLITYSLIACVKCISVADYKGLDEVSLQAIEYMEQKTFNTGRSLAIFLNQRILANRQMKRYDVALECLDKALPMQLEGTNNWFATKELSVTLNLHKKDFQKGFDIFQGVKNSKGFKHLSEIRKEEWLIMEAYLYCLQKFNKIKGDFADFKLTKAINSLVICEKDKSGRNVTVLILKTVFAIALNQTDDLLDQVEQLSRYRSRYAKGDSEARAYLFIKLLGYYANSGNNRRLALSESVSTYHDLLEEEYDINDHNHATEVIMYENLWLLIMQATEEDEAEIMASKDVLVMA